MEEAWFKTNPMGLMALDREGRICGANKAFEGMLNLAENDLLGHTRESLPAGAGEGLFGGDGELLLAGHWLQRQARELSVAGGETVTVHFFQDVTELYHLREENQRLRQRVEELAITDELTGLANHRALSQMLTAQVTRSRRYQNPLSLAMVEIAPLDAGSGDEPSLSDGLVLAISRYLRDRLRWADVIGRWDERHFMLLLPETSGDAAQSLIKKISQEVSQMIIPEDEPSPEFQLRFGLAEWRKGLDARKFVEQIMKVLAGEEAIAVSYGR
jgi:diguanylate cyclase (GGDEF)-like protein